MRQLVCVDFGASCRDLYALDRPCIMPQLSGEMLNPLQSENLQESVCVSAADPSQRFNKLTWRSTEAAEVELHSPETTCQRVKDRNTGAMPKPHTNT